LDGLRVLSAGTLERLGLDTHGVDGHVTIACTHLAGLSPAASVADLLRRHTADLVTYIKLTYCNTLPASQASCLSTATATPALRDVGATPGRVAVYVDKVDMIPVASPATSTPRHLPRQFDPTPARPDDLFTRMGPPTSHDCSPTSSTSRARHVDLGHDDLVNSQAKCYFQLIFLLLPHIYGDHLGLRDPRRPVLLFFLLLLPSPFDMLRGLA
jgi:hypothetical protein